MDDVVARQLAQNLAFKVEAVPQEGISPTRTGENMTPLNVKIRVRKKDDGKSHVPKGIIFVPKSGQAENLSERLRLASSDHTILSFNMLMETDHERKRKNRKNTFFGSCLGAQTDDDDGPYLPTTDSRSESKFTKSKLKNTAPDEIGTSQALMRKNTNFFGACKPGGCLDPPYGEDRYAYQPAPLKQTEIGTESNTKGIVNKETKPIPPIRIEPVETSSNADERQRNSVVKVDPKEFADKAANHKPRKSKELKGKEVIKSERKLSESKKNLSDTLSIGSSTGDQDRNNVKIEKVRNTSFGNRPQSNEFNTLFFSPPKKEKDYSKDSDSGRRDSKLEQRRNTLEAIKTSSNKDDKDKQKPGLKIDDKTATNKQISSAPIIILSDTDKVTMEQNRSPEIPLDRPQEQSKTLRDEKPVDIPKIAVPTTDKNKAKELDSKQIPIQKDHTAGKHLPEDTANVNKNRNDMAISSNLTESQQDEANDIDEDKKSGKGSLVMSPITEIFIPPVDKTIKDSQTENLLKLSESPVGTRKYIEIKSKDESEANGEKASKTLKGTTMKDPVQIEKLRGEVNDIGKKDHSPNKDIINESQIPNKVSHPTELFDSTTQSTSILKEKIDQPFEIPEYDLYNDKGKIPAPKKPEVNQLPSKKDQKYIDDTENAEITKPYDLPEDKYQLNISPKPTNVSIKTKDEQQSDQAKKDQHKIAQDGDSKAGGNRTFTDNDIELQPHQLLKEQFKDSPELNQPSKKLDQDVISNEAQQFKYTPGQKTEPHQPTIPKEFPTVDYQKLDSNNQMQYPGSIQDSESPVQTYNAYEQQSFDHKKGIGKEGRTQGLLDESQVSSKRADDAYINLAFQKYKYDNKIGIKTLDADRNFESGENIVTYKSNSNAQDKEIMIPIDGQNMVAIKIKKSTSTGNDDEKELLSPRSNIHTFKEVHGTPAHKRNLYNETQKDYTDVNHSGFELSPTKRRSLTESKHGSKSETGANVYVPKRSSIAEIRRPETFGDRSDFETGIKLSDLDSKYSDSVDLLRDRSGSKVTSPTLFERSSVKRIPSLDTSTKQSTVSGGKRGSLDGRRKTDIRNDKGELLDDIGSRTYLQKRSSSSGNGVSRDGRANSKGEFFSFIPSSNIADIGRTDDLNISSRKTSTISGKGSLGRRGIGAIDDRNYFFNDTNYGRNDRTDTANEIPTFTDGTMPAKIINSFVSRSDSKPTISSFKGISLTGTKRESPESRSEVEKASYSYFGENISDSMYGRNESGTRNRGTYDDGNSDYTDRRDDKPIGVIKYDSFFDSSKVDSFNENKSDRSSDTSAFYPFEDDKANYSKAGSKGDRLSNFNSFDNQDTDKRIHGAAYSRSRSMDRDDAYRKKRMSHEEGDRRGSGKIYVRSIDVGTDFPYGKPGSRSKVVKYSDEDDSRITIIGREINRTLSFIYEHELIPLQNVIKGLKGDIDVLAEQQVLLREKLHGPKRVRPVRKCGCYKKYDFCSILE